MIRSLIFCLSLLLFSCTETSVETNANFEQIELPDESVVILNQNSSLSYDPGFTERKVKLKGEAFFDVTKGTAPFTVITDLGEIKVLGTEFNVKSDLESLEVQVKEGLVELKNNDLINQIEDGMKATFKKGEKQIKKTKADLNYHKWVSDFEKEIKKLGKELKKEAESLKKESQKIGKDLKKDLQKGAEELKEEAEELKKESKKLGENITKDIKKGAEELQEEAEELKDKIQSAVKD